MAIRKNKLSSTQKKTAEKIKSRLQRQMGKDEAAKRAYRQVAQIPGGGGGGSNAAGEPRKHNRSGLRKRTGSDSNAAR